MIEKISKSIINTTSEAFKYVRNIIINAAQFVLKNVKNILIWAFLTAISIGAVTYIDATTNNIICSGESFDRVYRYIGEN